jgi:protein subunit release factor B
MSLSPQKEAALKSRMKRLGILERDLREQFVRSSGRGGQKLHKTSNCVVLLHETSGIEVKCQKTRQQVLNRYYARQILCDKLERKILGKESEAERKRWKIKKQKKRRSKRAKEKILEEKKKQSEKKRLRASVRFEE